MHPSVKLTDAAKEAAMKELGHTGDTDSEIEGLDVWRAMTALLTTIFS